MTLCLAWRKNGIVSLASDSRATVKKSNFFDHCIKVSKVPIKILGPLTDDDKYPNQPHESNIGIATAGNFLNAANIKENLNISLSSLQAIPGITDISMEGFCKLIKNYFELISKKLTKQIFKNGHSKFFVIGHCLVEDKTRAFLFTFENKSGEIEYVYNEILHKDGDIEFLGSGKKEAVKKFVSLEKTPPLKILREIIHDNNIKSVGGSIQYGHIKYRSFSNCGVVDFEVDHSKKIFANVIHLNGIQLLENDFIVKVGQFHINIPYIDPFKDQTQELIDNGYMAKNSL